MTACALRIRTRSSSINSSPSSRGVDFLKLSHRKGDMCGLTRTHCKRLICRAGLLRPPRKRGSEIRPPRNESTPQSVAPEPTTARRKRVPPPLADVHADVAFVDIDDIRSLTRMSPSWVHEEVRRGTFPAPVVRKPRFTRWRLADVRAWLIQQAATEDPAAASRVLAKAKKASIAAQAKRASSQS